MMHIVLHEPQIPQNTGNIVRTCKATGAVLHLIEPMGFRFDDKKLRRAGLDYWRDMDIRFYEGFDDFARRNPGLRCWFFTTKGQRAYHEADFGDEDALVFGREDAGLPEAVRATAPARCLRIPMLGDTRSLNLSNTVALALYEALRRQGFPGLH